MVRPICPPKPRVRYLLNRFWIVDTGGETVPLFDTWREAMNHAERICDDYEDKLAKWIADGNW